MLFTRFFTLLALCSCLFLNHLGFAQKTEHTARELIFKMIKSILKITERGKKGYNYYESSVKLNRSPRKIYVYIKGIELIWVNGWNGNKAYVKPNSFPYINLSLDPLGSLMRQDQHHTLNEMGFDYFSSISTSFLAIARANASSLILLSISINSTLS